MKERINNSLMLHLGDKLADDMDKDLDLPNVEKLKFKLKQIVTGKRTIRDLRDKTGDLGDSEEEAPTEEVLSIINSENAYGNYN